MTTQDRPIELTRAINTVVRRYPFYGSLLLQLPWIQHPDANGFATDGSAYYYNNDVVAQYKPTLTYYLMRLASHVALLHPHRMGKRDAKIWNRTISEVTNRDLKEAQLNLPNEEKLPEDKYAKIDKTAEQYYEYLVQSQSNKPKQQSSGSMGMPQKGASGSGQSGDSSGDGSDGQNDPLSKALASQNGPTGVIDPNANSELSDDEFSDGQASSKIRKMSKTETESMVRAAAQMAQQMGTLPAEIKRLIEELDAPKRDWRTELLHLLSDKRPGPKNYNRCNRRFISQGIYLPTRVKEVAGSLVLGIDTSGSIDTVMLSKFAAHIKELISQIPFNKIVVIFCDADVAGVHEYEPTEFDTINLKNAAGGGGTAFEPVIKYTQKMMHKGDTVDALVYFTDGYGSYGQQPDEFPVVWAMTTDYQAPWGIQVQVDCS